MDSVTFKEKLGKLLKGGPPNANEICAIWIGGIVAYALCTKIEPYYMEGWFTFQFLTFSSVPPKVHEWRVKSEHLHGDEFTLNSNPVMILALKVYADTGGDDPNTIKAQSWKEMIDGDDEEEPDNGGKGCPDQCDTPCS